MNWLIEIINSHFLYHYMQQMITKEDAPNTIEFKDFYIILPQMQFSGIKYEYPNAKPVAPDFEYHSGNNDRWLTVGDMKELISEI